MIEAGHRATGIAETKNKDADQFYVPVDKAGNAVFVALHIAAFLFGVAATVFLRQLIPTGEEGGWLTRIYVGVLLYAGIVGNVSVGAAVFVRKRQSIVLTVLGVLVLLPPALGGLALCTRLW